MIRLFAALAIPEDIAQDLVARQDRLPGARWRPPEAFHITLRFVGDVAENVAADLDAELTTVGGGPLELSLQGVGAFGEGADIHAIWAGVEESEALRHLARRHPGLLAGPEAEWPQRLAAFSGLDPEAVFRALRFERHSDPDAFTDALRTLDHLRKLP